MKKVVSYGLYSLWAAVLIASAFAAGYLTHPDDVSVESGFPLLAEVRHIVEQQFLGPVPSGQVLEYGAIRGMVATLDDPYTRFVEPQPHQLETHDLQGAFGGIGAQLHRNQAGEVVLSPYPDRPAAKAGVQAGDILIAVEGTAVEPSLTLEAVSLLIRGPVGAPVNLEVRRGESRYLKFTLVREEIELPSVSWRQSEGDAGVGIISVSRFSDRTASEIEWALADLQAHGASRFVLDLRDNPGGLLDAGIEVAEQFLGPGIVMFEQKRGEPERTFEAKSSGAAAGLPLVVLVNQGTASAAEIVAGALQDRGRAELVGERTYGKGSVQLVFDLPDGSSVHVTAARWYTPSRDVLDGVGLQPDVPVPTGADGSDVQLARAIQFLQNGQ